MPLSTAHMATLAIGELAALAAEIERHDPATAEQVQAICERYGLVFADASNEEMPCR